MKLYDFDKTIYKKDSTAQFYKFCLKKKPSLARYWFLQLWAFAMYLLGIRSKTKMKEKFYSFLKPLQNVEELVSAFWEREEKNINAWFYRERGEGDVVVSASPEFLLAPVCSKLGVRLIASRVDAHTGKYTGENCWGEEKVARLREEGVIGADACAESAFSDSLSDLPMLRLARRAYIVRGEELIDLEAYRPGTVSKLKREFFSREFFQFLVVGVINAANGTLFGWLFSLILPVNAAFVCGYAVALTIAYFLNTFWIFRQKLSVKKFVLFCVSYIPNFIIQNGLVFLLYNLAHLNRVLVFALSALIAVPITFLCVKFLCFLKKSKGKAHDQSKRSSDK